jgi:hypothetical protein
MSGGHRLQAVAGKRSDRVKAYGRGRVCATPGCFTILSDYNPSGYCSLHGAGRVGVPHRKPDDRALEERRCIDCGLLFTTTNPKRLYCSDHCRMSAFMRRKKDQRAGAA